MPDSKAPPEPVLTQALLSSHWLIFYVFFSADSELVEFLSEEIAAETSNQKAVTEIPGFVSKKEGAELIFTKTHGNEK